MSYGHAAVFFATPADAQRYLDGCAAAKNYTAENYQDRVAAQRCIRHAAGWSPDPIPHSLRSRAQAPLPTATRPKRNHSR